MHLDVEGHRRLVLPGDLGNLAIAVLGTFNGSRLGTTAMYGVGTPTDEQKRTPGEVTTDSSGQRIKVLPSGK